MAFVKYTAVSLAASTAHVRLSATSLIVTQAEQDRFPQLAAAECLALYYNPEGLQIGLRMNLRHILKFLVCLMFLMRPLTGCIAQAITLEGAVPTRQNGSVGEDRKASSFYGHVLGQTWGGHVGDFAEYAFAATSPVSPAFLAIRYARGQDGVSQMEVSLDGSPAGRVAIAPTGGWGDAPSQFATVVLALPGISAGRHRLRLTIPAASRPTRPQTLFPVPVLDMVGHRPDKNTVGHGRNVALYTGTPSRFFYATQNMSDVFTAADGQTMEWFPDYVLVNPQGAAAGNVNIDRLEISPVARQAATKLATSNITEQRQVCVTKDDVVVSRIFVSNAGVTKTTHRSCPQYPSLGQVAGALSRPKSRNRRINRLQFSHDFLSDVCGCHDQSQSRRNFPLFAEPERILDSVSRPRTFAVRPRI